MTADRWALLVGAVAGAVFTRVPYLEDGNLLITTFLMVFAAFFALIVWRILKRLIKW